MWMLCRHLDAFEIPFREIVHCYVIFFFSFDRPYQFDRVFVNCSLVVYIHLALKQQLCVAVMYRILYALCVYMLYLNVGHWVHQHHCLIRQTTTKVMNIHSDSGKRRMCEYHRIDIDTQRTSTCLWVSHSHTNADCIYRSQYWWTCEWAHA